MKKYLVLLLFAITELITYGQGFTLHARFTAKDATCFNDGVVKYELLDINGFPLVSSDKISDIRGYYKTNEADFPHYTNYNVDTMLLDQGTYIVGCEAVYWDGENYVLLTCDSTITIGSSYVIPTASAIYTTATTMDGFGRRPTLDCINSGRIQLKIENGSFPYTITICRHGTKDTVRTVIFHNHQYLNAENDFINYSDAGRFDYKDYYTFDSLAQGDYDFYIVDGCGYGLPQIGQSVDKIALPALDYINVYASSGNFSDVNVIKIEAVLDHLYPYYNFLLPQWVKYRFTYSDGLTSIADWKDLPYTETNSIILYDTILGINSYKDVWDKEITFEYKQNSCFPKDISKSFKIYRPNENYFVKDHSDQRDSTYLGDSNPCVDKYYYHKLFYSIKYRNDASAYSYLPSNKNKSEDHAFHRYHYTHPLTWIYTDADNHQVIKRDTIHNIIEESYLFADEIEKIYGSYHTNDLHINIKRELVDGRNCLLYETQDILSFFDTIGTEICDWEITASEDKDHCCTFKRWIKVQEHHGSEVSPDGTIIKLVRSPYNNKFNFTATYTEATHSWKVTKDNLENLADVLGEYEGRSITFSDYCLPSGPYTFQIITPCDTFMLSRNYSFPDRYSIELTTPVVFSSEQECSDMYLTPVSGEFSLVKRNTSPVTGLDTTPEISPLLCNFHIINGPQGGFDDRYVNLNTAIRISMPGTYIVRYGPTTGSDEYCSIPFIYDTIVYNGGSIQFVYAYALLCNDADTSGNVYIKGQQGTEPYTYDLYSGPDLTGELLASNNTGVFENVSYTTKDKLSCLITDACNSYLQVNFIPSTWEKTQKIWFDGGLKEKTVCEGSYVTVHALNIGSILSYEWSGPNGFSSSSSDPEIYVQRGTSSGWYKVRILNTGCTDAITDSVYLTVIPAPTVEIAEDATVCPGSEVKVSFRPRSVLHSSDTVYYTVAFEDIEGITYKEMKGISGEQQTIIFTPTFNTKIYAVKINDGGCDYTISDDTIFINMRTDIISSCNITTQNDIVCYNDDATLSAKSTIDVPYAINWYSDYGLTHLLKSETIHSASQWSIYDTAFLTQKATLYVSVYNGSNCPSVYGVPTRTLNMSTGNTTLHCGDSYRLYDSGGDRGNYETNENIRHTFTTDNGDKISIKFNYLDIEEGAKLYVISGDQPALDSVLFTFEKNSTFPDIIISNSDKITFWFISSLHPSSRGWSATVEHIPGIAIADVRPINHATYHDYVCQRQSGNYDDPYKAKLWSTEIASKITEDVKKAGIYSYTTPTPTPDIHGCDSTTTLVLQVGAPDMADTTITTLDILGPYTWNVSGESYIESGLYTKLYTTADGCDSLKLLYLTVLHVDTFANEICVGDSTTLTIKVTEPVITWKNDLVPQGNAIGDVLLDDGSIIRPQQYDPAVHAAPKGIIFYLDSTQQHGWAVSLNEVHASFLKHGISWATGSYQKVHALTRTTDFNLACKDTNGLGNTLEIMRTASLNNSKGPASESCYYYDHLTNTVGTEHKGWYLPAYGQAKELFGVRYIVLKSLQVLSGKIEDPSLIDTTTPYSQQTSTEKSDTMPWRIQYTYDAKNIANPTGRAICTF